MTLAIIYLAGVSALLSYAFRRKPDGSWMAPSKAGIIVGSFGWPILLPIAIAKSVLDGLRSNAN